MMQLASFFSLFSSIRWLRRIGLTLLLLMASIPSPVFADEYYTLNGWIGQNPFAGTGNKQGKILYEDPQFKAIFLHLLEANMPPLMAEQLWQSILKQDSYAQVVKVDNFVLVVGFNCRWQGCPEHHVFFYEEIGDGARVGICTSVLEPASASQDQNGVIAQKFRQRLQFYGSGWPGSVDIRFSPLAAFPDMRGRFSPTPGGRGCFGSGLPTPNPATALQIWQEIGQKMQLGLP